MRIIKLDARNWRTALDFYDALLAAVGAPADHARNLNALIDSMIWGGKVRVEPPYTIRILGIKNLPRDSRGEIELLKRCLDDARMEFRTRRGSDIEVNFEIAS